MKLKRRHGGGSANLTVDRLELDTDVKVFGDFTDAVKAFDMGNTVKAALKSSHQRKSRRFWDLGPAMPEH